MAKQITVEVFWVWLTEKGATEDQMDAIEGELRYTHHATLVFDDGVATLLHRDVVLKALAAVDNWPWKDQDPVEFRKWLQSEVTATGILFWIVGADTLPLESA
jgi:hypothetical protein